MRYLLDTHIFLWWLNDNKQLKESLQIVISNRENQIFVSIVSAWEISLKHRAGKLPLKTTLQRCFELSPFEILAINFDHVLKFDTLPFHHRDPFDRLLVAQAMTEKLTLITADAKIKRYRVKVLE